MTEMTMHQPALADRLSQARTHIEAATSDFERLRMRDEARAIQEAAKILQHREIQVQAAELVARAEREIHKANPPKPEGGPGRGKKTIATDNGFNEEKPLPQQTIRDIRHTHSKLTDDQFEAAIEQAQEEQQPLTRQSLKRQARKQRDQDAADRREARMSRPPADDVELYHCAVEDLHSYVPAASQKLILTDPPYEVKSLDAWGGLAAFADHALMDGGLLVAMSGQYVLPQVMDHLGSRLSYHWTICYLQERARYAVHQRRLNTAWKPVLVYAKGRYDGEYFTDLVRPEVSAEHKNEHHKWQQDVQGMYNLLKMFASPGDTVCDPFIGSGTTALAARKLGCSVIGADIEQSCIEKTMERFSADFSGITL